MKAKILYLLPYFNLAGTETHVVELAKALKKDFDILVTAPKGYKRYLSEFTLEKMVEKTKIAYKSLFNSSKYTLFNTPERNI